METGEVDVTVLSVCKYREFRGGAHLAGLNPKFVVSCIVKGLTRPYQPEGSDLTFTVESVVVFAIDSLVKLFIEDDILGNTFRLKIDAKKINGIKRFFLKRV